MEKSEPLTHPLPTMDHIREIKRLNRILGTDDYNLPTTKVEAVSRINSLKHALANIDAELLNDVDDDDA